MKLGYFGDGPWAHLALKDLLDQGKHQVAFVCLRYDTQDPILRQMAEAAGLPVVAHPNVNQQDFLDLLATYSCDLLVSMSFNQILRAPILGAAPHGFINCHAGKLPSYRGRNILNWALINDEKEFGITVHQVDTGVDTGDIWVQEGFAITDEDDYASLLQKAFTECPRLLLLAIDKIAGGHEMAWPQSESHLPPFYCAMRRPGDEQLDWKQSSRDVFNFVRALCPPGPSARCVLRNDADQDPSEVLIQKVEWLPLAHVHKGIPGAVLEVGPDGVVVKTGDSFVRVLSYEAPRKLKVGDRLC